MIVYNNNGDTYDYFAYGQFAKFIQRGAVRIDSDEGDANLGSVAFNNPDGSTMLVVVNKGNSAKTVKVAYDGMAFSRDVGAKTILTFVWGSVPVSTSSPTDSVAPSLSLGPSESLAPSEGPSISTQPVGIPPVGNNELSVSKIEMSVRTAGPNWEAVA
jgi:hypothetical protein